MNKLLLCLLWVSGACSAQQWNELAQLDTIYVYAQNDNPQHEGTLLFVLSEPITNDGITVDLLLFTYMFNCDQPNEFALKKFRAQSLDGNTPNGATDVQTTGEQMSFQLSPEFDRLRWDVFCKHTLKSAPVQTATAFEMVRTVRVPPQSNPHATIEEFSIVSATSDVLQVAQWSATPQGASVKWLTFKSKFADAYVTETFSVNCSTQTIAPQRREDFFIFSPLRAGMIKTQGFSDPKRFTPNAQTSNQILSWCSKSPSTVKTNTNSLVNAYHNVLGKTSLFTPNSEDPIVVKAIQQLVKPASAPLK